MLHYPIRLLAKIVDRMFGAFDLYKEYVRRSNPTVLESATGFGLNLSLVLDITSKLDGKVYSIDLSDYSVKWARIIFRDFVKRGVLVVERGDLRKLHYRDSTFDYSLNHTTMHHINVNDVEAVIRELWRTLKYGGLLIVIDLKPLPLGVGTHSKKHLATIRESVRSSIENLFKVVDSGENRISYYIVAEKTMP